jgi:hypothetical protein
MKDKARTKKILSRSILVLGLVFLLIVSSTACSQNQVSDEVYNYLNQIRDWQSTWDSYESELESYSDPAYDLLLSELANMEAPPLRIFQRLEEPCGEIIYPPRDQEEYLAAHRLYLAAQRHMETMQRLEEESFLNRGDSVMPACDILQDIDASQQYRETCSITAKASDYLERIRYKWDSVFKEYFPEDYGE